MKNLNESPPFREAENLNHGSPEEEFNEVFGKIKDHLEELEGYEK